MHLPNPNPDYFPVEQLPEQIKKVVLEMQSNTQFPIPLIVSSMLGAMSLTCQNSINVELPVGSVSSISLFIVLVADSGEGKTPVDHYFTKPISDFEENEARKSEEASFQQKANLSTWKIEHKEIEEAIRRNRKKCLTIDNKPEHTDLLNLEYENLKQKLLIHLSKEPQQRRNVKFLLSNTTPAKIALDLYENFPSVGLFSDEAGSLFRGGALKDLGMLNQLWDGASLSVDRVSSPSFKVNDARLTISLMVQKSIFDNYLLGRGRDARDIGFIARCLVACPISTKGSRYLDSQTKSWKDLTTFQDRVTEILTQDKLDVDQGRKKRPVLKFSQEAKDHWRFFRNNIESDLKEGGYLADVGDCASKIATNVARMAAIFHFYEGRQGDISDQTISAAIRICSWFMNQSKRLFGKNPEIPIEVSDAYELEQSLVNWCGNHRGIACIKKSQVAQYGPSQLRKNIQRREAAINQLFMQNKIIIQLHGKTLWIILNPRFFPVPNNYMPQFLNPA